MSDKPLQGLSREELYEKVWSVSGVKLSEKWGVSDVAIAKRCKKLNVPRPPRGYWAKIEAGQKPRRLPLPPTPERVFIQEALKPIEKTLGWPDDLSKVHPLAGEFLKALKSAKLSYDKKRVHLRERDWPEAEISKDMVDRAALAFHALLGVIEARGIKFSRSQSRYDSGYFRKGHDRLYFKIEEILIDKPETAKRRKYSYSSPDASKVPCGRLTLVFKTDRYGSSKGRSWTEDEKLPLAAC